MINAHTDRFVFPKGAVVVRHHKNAPNSALRQGQLLRPLHETGAWHVVRRDPHVQPGLRERHLPGEGTAHGCGQQPRCSNSRSTRWGTWRTRRRKGRSRQYGDALEALRGRVLVEPGRAPAASAHRHEGALGQRHASAMRAAGRRCGVTRNHARHWGLDGVGEMCRAVPNYRERAGGGGQAPCG